MTRWRSRLARWSVATVVLTVTSGAGPGGALSMASEVSAGGIAPTVRATASRVAPGAIRGDGTALRVYYTNPVLVRAGERVLMPVDVVCATAEGDACAAMVTLGTRVGDERWRLTSVPNSPFLTFDLTGAASRAIARSASGAVEFFIRTEGPGGATAELGGPQAGRALRFFAVRSLRTSKLPAAPFGGVRQGRVALFLPWGTGALRAGLSPGNESATIGPSSFDVDAAGRIHLADPLQWRIATFDRGSLVAEANAPLGVNALVAVDPKGARYVADRSAGNVVVRTIGADGRASAPHVVAAGFPSEIHASASGVYVRPLPLDSMTVVADSHEPVGTVLPGLPVAGANLIRIGREHSIRVGIVAGDSILDAFEMTSEESLGEVALVQPDAKGGHLLALHVTWEKPTPGDRYQIIHVSGGRIIDTFAIPSASFTDMVPLARFRSGPDGDLYQLATFPDGVRVVRFDMGRER